MAVDAARAKSLFLAASDLADPAERAAYLDRECGGDAELRARVEALLAADDGGGPVLEGDATGMSEPTSHATVEPTAASDAETRLTSEPTTSGRQIGRRGLHVRRPRGRSPRRIRRGPGHRRPYTLLEVLGEGGMGTVYRAGQTNRSSGRWRSSSSRSVWTRARCWHGSTPSGRAGPDGPPQHRPRVRRRHHCERSTVLRDGAGERRADHRLLRPPATLGQGPAGVVRRRLPGGATRPPEGDLHEETLKLTKAKLDPNFPTRSAA